MTTAERDSRAQELRQQGLTYREIGEEMGESKENAWKRCNREKDRATAKAWKTAHREQAREYDRRYGEDARFTCPECGYKYGFKSGKLDGSKAAKVSGEQCPGCAEKRRGSIVEWWGEGLTLAEIADRLDWTINHVGTEIARMRQRGYDLPYRRPDKQPRLPEQVAA